MELISQLNYPVHLRARDVVLATKAARENGTLQALIKPGACEYYCEETQTRCAIGQAFTPEAARELQQKIDEMVLGNVSSLFVSNLITTDDIEALRALQKAHDSVRGEYALDENGDPTGDLIGPKAETVLSLDQTIEKLLTRLPA